MSATRRRTSTVLLALLGVDAIVAGLFTLESILMHFFGFVLALTRR
ncbi:MAG: hypothetical protein M3N17_01625 [Actinomycetota bacterium]|nr:hypothetical protein [Actinomycetota bacterium]